VQNKKTASFLIFILTIGFYIFTLLPSLAWGDGAKLQNEAVSGESFVIAEMSPDKFSPDPFIFSKVGVAAWDHPLYIVLGHLLIQALPSVEPLWLVNLVSAIFGAASVTLLFLLVMRFTNSITASLYASLSLAVSHTFWWHSSTPEVYTLFIFLLLVSFYLFDKFERTDNKKLLVYSAVFLGMAASTHVLAFLAMPALGAYHLIRHRDIRISTLKKLTIPLLGFLGGFSLYIIQFIRMSANFPLREIMGPVVGSTFLSQLITLTPALLGESLLSYIFFLTVQFGPVGLFFGAFGIREIFRAHDRSLQKIVFSFIVFFLFGIFYRVTDQFTFFITSYIFWAMFMGIGSDSALRLLPRKMHFPLLGLLGLLLLATPFFYTSLPNLAARYGLDDDSIGIPKIGTDVRNGLAYYINPNKRGDYDAYEFGSQAIMNLEPNAVVIAEWYTDTDEYFIFRYFTKVSPIRRDVTVVGWATEDPFSFDSQLALDVVEDSFPSRPVYLASLSDRFYAASKLVDEYCIVPENKLYRLYERTDDSLQCLGIESVTE
jgi:hypothetical protein